MATILQHKVVSALPTPLEPDSIYFVRTGQGYDQYVTNGAGLIVAYPSNAAARVEILGQYMHVRDSKPPGTMGGTFTGANWRTRDLNEIVYNTIPGATLAANQVTLPPGTYDIVGEAPAGGVDTHRVALFADSVIIALGTSEGAGAGEMVTTRSRVETTATAAEPVVLELRHHCASTRAEYGFGFASSITGANEVYSELVIRRIA